MLSFKEFIDLRRIRGNSTNQKITAVFIGAAPIVNFNESLETPSKRELSKIHRELINQFSFGAKQLNGLSEYKFTSMPINAYLLAAHHLNRSMNVSRSDNENDREIKTIVEDVDSAMKPIGMELHTHSSMGFDPREQMRSDGLLHLPAYTSTTIDHNYAYELGCNMSNYNGNEIPHILKLKLTPKDKGVYIEGAKSPTVDINEHEIVLPRNTTIRITHSLFNVHPKHGPMWIHHAEVVPDVSSDTIERSPVKVLMLGPLFKEHLQHLFHNPDLTAIESHLKRGADTLTDLTNLVDNVPHVTSNENVKILLRGLVGNRIRAGDFNGFTLYHAKRQGIFNPDQHTKVLENYVLGNMILKNKADQYRIMGLVNAGFLSNDFVNSNVGNVHKIKLKASIQELKKILSRDDEISSKDVEKLKTMGITDDALIDVTRKDLLKRMKSSTGNFSSDLFRFVDENGGFDDEMKKTSKEWLLKMLNGEILSSPQDTTRRHEPTVLEHALKHGYLSDDVVRALKDSLIRAASNSRFINTSRVGFAIDNGHFDKPIQDAYTKFFQRLASNDDLNPYGVSFAVRRGILSDESREAINALLSSKIALTKHNEEIAKLIGYH